MNWKNVLFLLRVERKSGRLIRGIKATRYRETSFIAYWPYWVAAILGVTGGFLAGYLVNLYYSQTTNTGLQPLSTEAVSFFSVLPTLVLGISIVFTLFQQVQLAGKASSQVMYWLPVTWQEHTLASILANLLGLPAAFVVGLSSGLIVFAAFTGLILQALLTIVILVAAAFLASSITEILRVLQTRFTGAVYKSSGRAAIWLRLIGSLVVVVIFYIIYFYAISGTNTFISSLTAAQNGAWYVPFVWPALIISYIAKSLFLQSLLYAALSAFLIAGLYYLAVELNTRFGLYEPPAITLQKSGVYAPKVGVLGKLGFSSVEAALIRKDLRGFTRRRELIGIYFLPIILVIVSIFYSFSGTTNSGGTASANIMIWSGIIFLVPASGMAMLLGQVLIGEEGQAVWRIFASPISAKNLVKSKFFLIMLFSVAVLVVTEAIGIFVFHPSLRKAVISVLEAFFMTLAIGSVSLQIGFKGPDFSGTRRARMVRQEWSLLGSVVGVITGVGVFAPVLAQYAFGLLSKVSVSTTNYAIGVAISAAISIAVTVIFYRVNLGSAQEFLRKAEI
ncbi:MAG: hypothetical protein ABSF44_07115 [Candidatus Bathyarchaeia archaeon]|jgi:hypothetical protein